MFLVLSEFLSKIFAACRRDRELSSLLFLFFIKGVWGETFFFFSFFSLNTKVSVVCRHFDNILLWKSTFSETSKFLIRKGFVMPRIIAIFAPEGDN